MKKLRAATTLAALVALAASCSLVPFEANLSLSIEVPEFVEAGMRPGFARALPPVHCRAMVEISGAGFDIFKEAFLAPGINEVTVAGVPLDRPLVIDVAVYDDVDVLVCSGTVSTSANATAPRLTLVPNLSGAETWSPVGEPALFGSGLGPIMVTPGSASYVEATLASATGGEFCVAIDDSPYQPWIRLYRPDGSAFPAIAADASDGWAVISIPAGGNVSFVAAIVSPVAGSVTLNAYRARFVDTDAPDDTGAGSSSSPRKTVGDLFNNGTSNIAAFVRGTSALGQTSLLTTNGQRFRLHGGFTGSGWTSRDATNARTRVRAPTAAIYALRIDDMSTPKGGVISGFDVGYDAVTSGKQPRDALSLMPSGSMTSPVVVRDCALSGPPDASGSAESLSACAAKVDRGAFWFVACEIAGGFATKDSTTGPFTSYGIYAGSSSTLGVRNSVVRGGTVDATTGDTGSSAGIFSASANEMKVVRSRVTGGSVLGGANSGTTGITTVGAVTAISSAISGGRLQVPTSTGTRLAGLSVGDAKLFGCTVVDGVNAGAATPGTSAAVYVTAGQTTGSRIAHSVVVSSVGAWGKCVHYPSVSAGSTTFFAEALLVRADPAATFLMFMSPQTPTGYGGTQVVTADATIEGLFGWADPLQRWNNILAGDFGPPTSDSRFVAAVQLGDAAIASWIGYETLVAAHPETLFDLVGAIRGTDWTRGAFEY